MTKQLSFRIYTDGTHLSDKTGGWAAKIIADKKTPPKMLHGAQKDTDIRTMEILAIVTGLNELPERSAVTVVTDVVQIREKMNEIARDVYKGKFRYGREGNPWGALETAIARHGKVETELHTRANPRGKIKNATSGVDLHHQEAQAACQEAARTLSRQSSPTR